MCLDTVTKKYNHLLHPVEWQQGFKVFHLDGDRLLTGEHWGAVAAYNRAFNKILIAKRIRLLCQGDARKYLSGFHILTSIKDAQSWAPEAKLISLQKKFPKINQYPLSVIVPVLYRKVALTGTQQGLPVVIAREMKVPKPTNLDWKKKRLKKA